MKKLEAISNTSQKDVKQKPLKASSNQIGAVWTQSVCNYLQSLITTVRALADLLKQRQSVYDVHDFTSKTINGYSFEGSLERMSTPISSASSDEP